MIVLNKCKNKKQKWIQNNQSDEESNKFLFTNKNNPCSMQYFCDKNNILLSTKYVTKNKNRNCYFKIIYNILETNNNIMHSIPMYRCSKTHFTNLKLLNNSILFDSNMETNKSSKLNIN